MFGSRTTVKKVRNSLTWFSHIAGLVRDMVGQQLELVEMEDKFPRNKKTTKKQNQTNKQHPHPSQAPRQAEKPGKFAN